MGKSLNIWEQDDYDSIIENEWFALGMVDPAQYKTKKDWAEALTHEREVKDLIYKIRRDDAMNNKYYHSIHSIMKYNQDYLPIPWDQATSVAFDKLGRPDCKYIYSPFSIPNLDEYYFDYLTANKWCLWIEDFIVHIEGKLANEKILLTVEQRSFFRNLFGWRNKKTGLRRFTEIFKYIPRKNSKTFDLAALALGIMILDGEGGCKVVSAANSEEQALLVLEPARQMIIKDRELKICNGDLAKYFKVYEKSITANYGADVFRSLTSKSSTNHGRNLHCSILDEVHEMVDDKMYEVVKTAQGSREQALLVLITTAATSEENFCNRKLDQSKKVCRGELKSDNFLPILYYADPQEFDDDWHDINVHKRVNPMYGLGKNERYMISEYNDAVNDPPQENSFLRLHLNWITASLVSAFNSVSFKNCAKDMSKINHKMILTQEVPRFLLGKRCYAGLDLASKNDLCSLTLDFPDSNWILSWSFTPVKNKNLKNKERFKKRINFCGDEIINFKELRELIIQILNFFDIIELGFDVRFATELIQILEEETNITCYPVPQGAKQMNEPIRIAITDIKSEIIKHNGCILFSWQISNCQLKEDAHQCFMIQKSGSNSPRKIDAAAAWMNARILKLLNNNRSETLIQRFESTGSYF